MPNILSERPSGRKRVVFACVGESKTEQNHRDEVNINEIVRRYQKTGVLPANSRRASYGDFTCINDYHSAAEAVRQADDAFMSLPSALRKRFGNDPGRLVAFLNQPENQEEAVSLGLIEAPVTPVEAAPAAGSPDTGGEEIVAPEGS